MIAINATTNAQEFKENFLGENFMEYKGSLFKINEVSKSGFTLSFYSSLKYCQSPYNKNIIYPNINFKSETEKDSLINRIFKVEDIIGKNGKTYSGGAYIDKPIFVLIDTATNETIYFLYDKLNNDKFPFLNNASKIELTQNIKNDPSKISNSENSKIWCYEVEREIDDFTNEIIINSRIVFYNKTSPVTIYKYINKNVITYYLSLKTYGFTPIALEKGVIILFEDGSKLNKPNVNIDIQVTQNANYEYSAFFRITTSELSILRSKKIKKFRLYIFDEIINEEFSIRFPEYVKCVMDMK